MNDRLAQQMDVNQSNRSRSTQTVYPKSEPRSLNVEIMTNAPVRDVSHLNSNNVLRMQQTQGNQAVIRRLEQQQAIQRREDNGCRKTTKTECPGSRKTITKIDLLPEMDLVNRGTCELYVAGLDNSGEPITDPRFTLQPGESNTFFPETGSSTAAFGCSSACNGSGLLEQPYNCA